MIAWFWLPQGPGSAWFLDAEEQVFAVQRIIKDNSKWVAHSYGDDGVEQDRLTKRDAIETVKDWKLWFLLFFNICASVPSQAFSVFMPMVVQGLGYSSVDANLVRSFARILHSVIKADVTIYRCPYRHSYAVP